jgi:hypothetical protein
MDSPSIYKEYSSMNENCKLHDDRLEEISAQVKDISKDTGIIKNILVPMDSEKIGIVEQTRKNKEDIEELKKTPSKVKDNIRFAITVALFIAAIASRWI